MIATRGGYCKGCHQGFEPGTPIFWHPGEGNWHWSCFESQPQPPHVVKLAEQLGYQKEVETFTETEEVWGF
jgi:hypothetical protein